MAHGSTTRFLALSLLQGGVAAFYVEMDSYLVNPSDEANEKASAAFAAHGSLDREGLRGWLQYNDLAPRSDAELSRTFAEFDRDADGLVAFTEIAAEMRERFAQQIASGNTTSVMPEPSPVQNADMSLPDGTPATEIARGLKWGEKVFATTDTEWITDDGTTIKKYTEGTVAERSDTDGTYKIRWKVGGGINTLPINATYSANTLPQDVANPLLHRYLYCQDRSACWPCLHTPLKWTPPTGALVGCRRNARCMKKEECDKLAEAAESLEDSAGLL